MGKKSGKNILFAISLIFILSFASIVAGSSDWRTYGGITGASWQEQTGGNYGYHLANSYNVTMTAGYSSNTNANTTFQPLVVNSISLIKSYLVFPNLAWLQVYNDNLVLQNEVQTGTSIGQIDILDYDNNNQTNDIAGLFSFNTTDFALKVYEFSLTTLGLTQTYQQNFSVPNVLNVSGVRHNGRNVYFIAEKNATAFEFYNVNSSGYTSIILNGFTQIPKEPIAFADMNGDGNLEYMAYGKTQLIVFGLDGTIYLQNSTEFTGDISSVKLTKADGTSLYRLAISGRDNGDWDNYIKMIRIDGSQIWKSTNLTNLNPTMIDFVKTAITDDYNGDLVPDIYAVFSSQSGQSAGENYYIYVLSGSNGAVLFSKANVYGVGSLSIQNNIPSSLTIADMDNSGIKSFIVSSGRHIFVYNPSSNSTIIYNTADTHSVGDNVSSSCIPADLDFNGYLDVICSSSIRTIVFFSNATNSNPTISSVAYSPSLSIIINSYLTAIVNAFDSDGDFIFYSHSCFNGDTWSIDSLSSTQMCYYSSAGNFNMSVRVKDAFHSTYNSFSQNVLVTDTGTICGNSICEAGETSSNCPADCPITAGQNSTQVSGGMTIPTKLVDVSNTEAGLLPEIYYGILGFISETLSPMIYLVFAILFALIIVAIAFIIKRVTHKIGDISK